MKQTLILGNIITMDEKRPFAKAALVKDGLFAYIGDAEQAKKLADVSAQLQSVRSTMANISISLASRRS